VLKRVREKNGELTLINIAPNILKVFEITQLNKAFTIV
jgi:anti-anti-sigma regulatory factor